MHGVPKYAPGFTHFDYVNPDAPKGGTLRLGVVGSFDSLNPFIVRGQAPRGPDFELLGAVYERLMMRSWDEPFSLYGLIVESLEVPEDRSSVTFNLRPEARWQDGLPITADDVLFSFKTLRDQGRPNHRTYYKKVERAERLDERKVRFIFKRNPDGGFDREMPLIMGFMPILPEHDWLDRPFNQTTLRIPVGSGPYRITALEPGRSLTLTRDPHYWGRDLAAQKGLYNFDTVRFDYYRDDGIALQAFKAGQFDLRRETDPNKWAIAYDSPALREGRIELARFAHQRPEPAQGFVFNTRRPLFQDRALREALGLAFDGAWINRSLFHGLYRRTESFFPNAELAATGVPEGAELAVLEPYRAQLPAEVFATALPENTEGMFRDHLLKAASLLKQAGYVLKEGLLYGGHPPSLMDRPSSNSIAFEILLSDPSEEKIALEWARALRRLGIVARVRTVDSAQYQGRLTSFDYDVTVARWINTLSPGNEQMTYWSTAAASQPGSRNYAGVRDPVIDALAASIPNAASRESLVATARALDRVLRHGHYLVPFYHLGADPIAFWPARLEHLPMPPLYGPVLESWWDHKGLR